MKKTARVVGVTALAATLLTGCGGGTSEPPSVTPSSPAIAATPSASSTTLIIDETEGSPTASADGECTLWKKQRLPSVEHMWKTEWHKLTVFMSQSKAQAIFVRALNKGLHPPEGCVFKGSDIPWNKWG